MIIRSQDKRRIINFNQVLDLVISKNRVDEYEILVCYPYFAESDCGYSAIATYSTEEKAIKVLDMIWEIYKEPIVRANYTNEESLIYSNSVFQMPSNEDVEV